MSFCSLKGTITKTAFQMLHRSCLLFYKARAKWILLRHRPQRLCATSSQPSAKGTALTHISFSLLRQTCFP